MTARECALCGLIDRDVLTRLARWADPSVVGRFDSIDRCRDDEACRIRVESSGQEWPLALPADLRRERASC